VSRIVVIVLLVPGIVDRRNARLDRAREGALVEDVVDEAGIVPLPADEAHGSVCRQRDVREALEQVAAAALGHRAAFEVVTGLESGHIRLVGDDANRSRLRAGAIQRALRAR
jgi:hypothetical protein